MAKHKFKSNKPLTINIDTKKSKQNIENSVFFIEMIDVLLEAASMSKTFKIGDVLIVKEPNYDENIDDYVHRTMKDGYGLPTKYIIVAQSRRSSVSVVQKLNSDGKPYGQLRLLTSDFDTFDSELVQKMVETQGLNVLGYASNNLHNQDNTKLEFSVDPDLEDAILTGSEYAPCEDKKKIKVLRREVTEFNDCLRVDEIRSMAAADKFIKTLKKGQTYWTSNKKFFLINSVSRDKSTVKISINGTTPLLVDKTWFFYKRIYTDRPKSSK